MAATNFCNGHRTFWCTRSIYFLTRTILLHCCLINISDIEQAHAAPVRVYSFGSSNGLLESARESSEAAYSSEATFISFGLLVTLVLFAVLCTGGCCLNIFGKRQQENHTMGFSNPIADLTSNTITSIDVRSLELGQIEFEPLPRLQDLTPVSCYSYGSYRRGDSAARSGIDSSLVQVTAIVPTDETSIYAHDWFDEPYHNFPRTHIEYVKEVGKGWFGKVIESEAEDIVPYAKKLRVLVKVLREDASGTEQMRFLDESRLYRESNHGNILKLLGHSIEKLPFLLIMEHCPQGDLKSFLIANVSRAELLYSQGALLRMGHDIAKGLEWMGSTDFIHKDLAARNCQVGSEGRIIIGDYGLSVQNFRDDYYWGSNVAIPLRWSAPETLHCTINTIQTLKVLKTSNVWTFGVVLWEIFEFGKLPYSELTDDDVISRVITDRNYTLGQISRPGFALKDELYKIMLSCWNPQPESRPNISAIVDRLNGLSNSVSDRHVSQIVNAKLPASFSKEDEFDRKWDEFAEKVNSPQVQENTSEMNWDAKHKSEILNSNNNNHLKKKSVSFVGLADEIPAVQVKTKLSTANQFQVPRQYENNSERANSQSATTVNSHESSLNSSSNITAESQGASLSSDSSGETVSGDKQLWKVSRDPDEDSWRKRIELDEISQKVKEKSQSVQDLMVLTHVEPSDLSDPDSLVIVCNQGQNAKLTSAPLQLVSNLTGTGESVASSISENAVLKNSKGDLKDVALKSTKESIAPTNAANENADVSSCESQVSKYATSQDYNENVSTSLGNSDRAKQVLNNSSVSDLSLPSLGTNSRLDSAATVDHSVSTKKVNSESISVRPATGSSLLRLDLASHEDVDAKTASIHQVSSAMSPTMEVPTLKSYCPPAGFSAADANASRAGCAHNVFPTSHQPVELTAGSIKGRAGLEQRNLRKVQKNFRTTKTSAPNFSSGSDETGGHGNSSFFQRNDNVFEDFSMEFNNPISPVRNVTAPTKFATECNDQEKYGQSNVLLGPSDDLGLNLYQRLTTELVSEYTSPGCSDSSDNFDTIGVLCPSQSISHSEGLDTSGTDNSMSVRAPPARTLETSTEGSHTDVSQTVIKHEPFSNIPSSEEVRHEISEGKIQAQDEIPSQCSSTETESKTTESSPAVLIPSFHLDQLTDTRVSIPPNVDIIGRDTFLEDIEAAADELGSLVMTDLDEENPEITVIKETREEERQLERLDVTSLKPALNAFENVTEKLVDASYSINSTPNQNTALGVTPHESEVTFMMSDSGKSLFPESENGLNEEKSNSKPSLTTTSNFECEDSENGDEDGAEEENICRDFVPSKWNQNLTPIKPSIKSPEPKKFPGHGDAEAPDLSVTEKSSMKKSVSFERKKIQLVYQYPPPPPPSDSDDEEKHTRTLSSSAPFSSALDWELQPEELENTDVHPDDSEDEVPQPKPGNPMDVYRISTDLDNFLVRPSTEPFVFSPVDQIIHSGDFIHNRYPSPASYSSISDPSTLGQLRHTRNRLKLDLSKGEASLLDGENGGDLTKLSTGKLQQLDSGVGSSTNVSPFNSCDNQSVSE